MPPSADGRARLALVHEFLACQQQIPVATEHVLHGGMYARTIRLEAGTVIEGSLIKLATVLIVNGKTQVWTGDEVLELDGYNVIRGCAGRKQVFVAQTRLEMTMIVPTTAKTVEEAEDEVFAEAEHLISRKDGSSDTITITGE